MKRSLSLIALLTLALVLTACGGTPVQTVDAVPVVDAQPEAETVESAPEADVVDEAPAETGAIALNMDYEDALSQKLLLSLGTMELADTEYALTSEQASLMLFYWQALNNMTASGNSATEEVAAILLQIEETFTVEQITAINAMQLTSTDLQTWATENQIAMGTGTGTGGGQGQGQGGGGGMDADARATKQAEEGVAGTAGARENGVSAAVNNALIEYLTSISK